VIPILLSSPETMSKVRVITLKEYSEQVLKTLHKVGVLHIERSEELAPVGREALEKQQKEVNELLTFVNDVLGYVTEKQEVVPKEDVEVIYTGPFGEINKEVRSLYVRFSEQHEKLVKTDIQDFTGGTGRKIAGKRC